MFCKKVLFCIIIFSVYVPANSQNITVNNAAPYNSPYWLAENVLVDPQFAIFAPINPSTGLPIPQPNSVQVGRFEAVGTPLGLDSGIVMMTDNIAGCVPGNNDGSMGSITPDADLLTVLQAINSSNTNIRDKAEIQFSFVATSDSIRFNYVFASREYQGYTCSSFNDVFGFFLTGPGINGNPVTVTSTVNLATIPNTTVPVAINTINQGFPSGSNPASNCLSANPNYVAHSTYYVSNANWVNQFNSNLNSQVNMAGWTVPFTAKAQVNCGSVYTIKLKIADVADGAFSSAVFLEAKSFASPTINISTNLNTGNSFNDSLVVEGCKPSYIIFEKDGNLNEGMGMNFVFTGAAQNGVDFTQIPDSLWIPPGQAKDSILIEAIDDGLAEANEDFIITMQPVTTNCYVYPPQQKTIYVRDKDPVTLATATYASSDTIFCPGDTASIFGSVGGGEGVITGMWLDDTTAADKRTVQPAVTTTYYYVGFDECNDTIVDSVTIYLANYIPITYNVDSVLVCRGDTAYFQLDVQNGRPPYSITWSNGTLGDQMFDVPSADTTYYSFTILDQCGISITDSTFAEVAPDAIASFSYTNALGVPLRVEFSNRSSNAVSYMWDFGDGNTSTDESPTYDFDRPGTYPVTLSVVTADGCTDEITLQVTVETDFYIYVPTAFTPDGDGLNECFEVKGVGFEEYEIKIFDRWGNQVFYADNIDDCWDGTVSGQPAAQGVYSYTIFLRLPFDKIHQKTGTVTVYR